MTIAPFPHRYVVGLVGAELVASPRAPIALGPPPQFGGTDRVWSPEDLLIGATLECLWTTFQAYARRDGLEVHEFAGRATGVLDRGPSGPVFTTIELAVEVAVATGDEERVRRLLAKAEANCLVSRALAVPVSLVVTVRAVG